jgi:hypothetical protein
MPPLSLSDDQLLMIQRAAAPLDVELRAPFLETVAKLLASEPVVENGSVARACKAAQAGFSARARDELGSGSIIA